MNKQTPPEQIAVPSAPAMGSGADGLDHEIVNTGREEWQVWTPGYPGGACIGSGKTVRLAKEDAIRNMEHLCDCLMDARKRPNAERSDGAEKDQP